VIISFRGHFRDTWYTLCLQSSRLSSKNGFENFESQVDEGLAESLFGLFTEFSDNTRFLFPRLVRFAEYTLNPANNINADPALVFAFLSWFERLSAFSEGADSWFNVSSKTYETYWECPGDQAINWKNNGYYSAINLLTVIQSGKKGCGTARLAAAWFPAPTPPRAEPTRAEPPLRGEGRFLLT